MKSGIIYCITNKINGKKYIGKTMLSIEERWKQHLRDGKKEFVQKRPLYSAFKKYGSENFEIQLLEEVPANILNERECYWITTLDTYSNGYNATTGGDGTVLYDYNAFIQDYLSGSLVKEIANKYGCEEHTVTKVLHAVNINGNSNNVKRQQKQVSRYTMTNEYIDSFDSYKDAARQLIMEGSKGAVSTIATNIGRVINGKRKTCEGYYWKNN